MNWKRAVLAAKLLLGIALLAALLGREETLRELGALARSIRPVGIPAVVAMAIPLLVLSCLKWGLFLRASGSPVGLGRLSSLYAIGMFFNNFLPGMLGGDLVRSWALGKRIDSQHRALVSVFLERFTGLVALLVLGAACLAATPALWEHALVRIAAVFLGGGCAAAIAVLLQPRLVRPLVAPFRRFGPVRRGVEQLQRLHAEIAYFRGRWRLLAAAMAYSFAFHLCTGLNLWVASWALRLDLRVLEVVALTPMVLLVSVVPLTPNNIGVWEWAHSVLLQPAGATAAEGLAMGLAIRAQTLVISVWGAILFLLERSARRARPEDS